LIPILIKEIKELKERIKTLETTFYTISHWKLKCL
jgi:hypothetical protein